MADAALQSAVAARPSHAAAGLGEAAGRASARPAVVHVLTRDDADRLAPVVAALERRPAFRQVVLWLDGGTPAPDRSLSLSILARVAEQRAVPAADAGDLVAAVARVLSELRPAVAVAVGDGPPALAGALAAYEQGVPLAYLGLGPAPGPWPFDGRLCEQVTGRLADVVFCHASAAEDDLDDDAEPVARVHALGNTLVDTVRACQRGAAARRAWLAAGLRAQDYVLVELDQERLDAEPARAAAIVGAVCRLAQLVAVAIVVPSGGALHRPSAQHLLALRRAGVVCLPDPDQVERLSLQLGARAVVTDRGDVQEETSALGVPCFTLAGSSARVATLTHGTNVLLGDDPAEINEVLAARQPVRRTSEIAGWDGHAGERVAAALARRYGTPA